MAKIEIVTLTDSLDERIQTGVETRQFFNPLTGEKLEIELGEANWKHFQNHLSKLDKYIDVARAVELPKIPKSVGSKSDLTVVREWAKANGFTVGDRGRISATIFEAYDKAQMPTAVAGDKVVLTVSPEAEVKLEEIANTLEPVTALTDPENVVMVEVKEDEPSAEDLADVEAENVPMTDDDILAMMAEIEAEKGNVTLEDLTSK
jgi:uncharacterized membrane protein